MELAEVIYKMVDDKLKGSQLADLQIGTVTAAAPLEIVIDTTMAALRSPILYLTEAVIEKKIPILEHKHIVEISDTYTGGGSATCSKELLQSQIIAQENGRQLPVENGYIILNEALKAGDKVLLLRVQGGQKFIVLSRVYGGGGA